MSGHTPGPWSLEIYAKDHTYRTVSAGCRYYGSPLSSGFCLSGFASGADADLLVSAPDLLDALSALVAKARCSKLGDHCAAELAAADAAIIKAGGQPCSATSI